MSEYPDSLKDVKIDLQPVVFEKQDELSELNNYDYDVSFDLDALDVALESLDAYRVSDFWHQRFGTGYYCGILNLEPWCLLLDQWYKYGCESEEDVWQAILAHHVKRDGWTLGFSFNPVSPINAWLRTHSRDGDTATNVQTLLNVAFLHALDQDSQQRESDLWNWQQKGYCSQCDMLTWYEDNSWTPVCPECGTELGDNPYV
jgi:hypothetical protein